MITRVLIVPMVPDARASVRLASLIASGFTEIDAVSLADVYTIEKKLRPNELAQVSDVLTNPVTHRAFLNAYIPEHPFSWSIEVGFLPGVTDNVASTVREIIADRIGKPFSASDGVYSSQLLFVSGRVSAARVKALASGLINPLIERITVKDRTQYVRERGMRSPAPKVTLRNKITVDLVNLNVDDAALIELGKKGIQNRDGSRRGPLALDLPSLTAIQKYFAREGRNPTDVELESIAQTWSEHCKHTIFARPLDDIADGLFRHYIRRATNEIRKKLGKRDFCVSVFTDNSGGIAFGEKYVITHKVETHNSPSALDPFGGAVTGIVGVNRDCLGFGLGAKPVANTYGFCFADKPRAQPLYRDRDLTQPLLHPSRIMSGVIAGVNTGGNCSGIPTPQGFIYFDRRFQGKPLVFVGTVGLLPRRKSGRILYEKKAKPGDYIVMVGGRVGIDGIHGATFSSEALTGGSPATAVQIGDPITQKKVSDLLIKEARDLGLYTSITDNGAGGLSCSVAEMAKEAGGCLVDLEKVPLKYPGLSPWQIWISESQERMTLSVPKSKWKTFRKLASLRGVEATEIGSFTRQKRCIVRHRDKTVMDVSMDFLHNGLPNLPQKSAWQPVIHKEPTIPAQKDMSDTVLRMLRRPNLSGFSWISMQYDHEVQGTSVVKPLVGKGRVNGDASVIRPVLDNPSGVVLTQALYPGYSDIDTYEMAASSIDTAIRNAVAAGADPATLALLDNFCWCSAKDPFRLGQLKRAAEACYDLAVSYRTPFISGKDSMFNDFSGFDAKAKPITISIPPTLLVSAIGIIRDVTNAVSPDFKCAGDSVYLLGETHEEFGGSEYFAMLSENQPDAIGNRVPVVDAARNVKVYAALGRAIRKRLIASAQSVHRGGLAVALSKSVIGGQLGASLSLARVNGRATDDFACLFSESQGRVLVSVDPKKSGRFEQVFRGLSCRKLGEVTQAQTVRVTGKGEAQIVRLTVTELTRAYRSRFARN